MIKECIDPALVQTAASMIVAASLVLIILLVAMSWFDKPKKPPGRK